MMARKGSGGRSGSKARSAITGRYVTKRYARAHPRTTVVEASKRRSAKK
jgi:hypothetical protein